MQETLKVRKLTRKGPVAGQSCCHLILDKRHFRNILWRYYEREIFKLVTAPFILFDEEPTQLKSVLFRTGIKFYQSGKHSSACKFHAAKNRREDSQLTSMEGVNLFNY